MLFQSSRSVLLEHVRQVQAAVPLKNKVDRANADLLQTELHRFAKRHATLGTLRAITFVFLYASVVSAFSVPVLSDVLQGIAAFAGFIGVSVLSLAVLYISYRMRELLNRMLIIYGHLIAIYEKNNKSATYSLQHLPA